MDDRYNNNGIYDIPISRMNKTRMLNGVIIITMTFS